MSNRQNAVSSARLLWGVAVVGLLGLAALVTYVAGGTKTPLPHAFYLPVVVAAGIFGARIGVATALTAGIVCGPLMPLDVATGQSQTLSGWVIRLGFFLMIALVVGLGRNRMFELIRARQDFLSIVSHEIRTPLTSVLGFASLLDLGDHDDCSQECREFAEVILREATELSNVVDHYLIEGRLKDSALFVDPQPTDLRRVVDIVVETVPAEIRERRVMVRGSDVICQADPLRLRQVLRSMVNNALAYSAGPIAISVAALGPYGVVRIVESEHSTGRVKLPQIRTHVSGRGDTAAPLGLGLAVARDLAGRMDGELRYRVEETTEFSLRLPLNTPAHRRHRARASRI